MNSFLSTLHTIQSITDRFHRGKRGNISSGNLLRTTVPESPFIQGEGLTDFIAHQRNISPATGWILWSEQLEIITANTSSLPHSSLGWPLSAELYFQESDTTLKISQKGKNWTAYLITKTDEVIDPELLIPTSFIEASTALPWPQIKERSNLNLQYEVAWSFEETAKTPHYRPSFSRFIGFA